jgi:gamma-butyrobetaine dioxygenase
VTGIEAIAKLFAGPGSRDYLGEAVTIGEHMRQAGALAEAAGAAAPIVAAALLHDIGHLRSATDARHGPAGAQWLGQWFGPAVTEPVRLHVAAPALPVRHRTRLPRPAVGRIGPHPGPAGRPP